MNSVSRRINSAAAKPACRFCGTPLSVTFVDLGMSPLCESFLAADELNRMEPFYPLLVHVCDHCFLVQLQEYVAPADIFTNYAYFSSYSTSWLDHARRYVEMAIDRLSLGESSLVVELASNDGYLLQYFVERGVPVLGVEPALNVAAEAKKKGVPTRTEFFGVETARAMAGEGKRPDLIVGNNVLAQVPDLNDFVAGMKLLLAPSGTITLEFPHLSRLIAGNQFDTIYHEHFSYFSLYTVERIFAEHGLRVYDVEELTTHGGSLRVYGCHQDENAHPVGERVLRFRQDEADAGVTSLSYYSDFTERVMETKRKLLSFLIEARNDKRTVAGYGAPGKGNTLLNYCGIRSDLLAYTVDRNPFKHNKFLPGTHIPIYDPSRIRATRPDYILILPWNLKDEIMADLAYAREWGARFLVPITEVIVDDLRRKRDDEMKVVLFCGGLGMRLREHSESVPKPMVPIGYRPVLWHVMKYYAHFGHKDFVLCLGYKADVIKEYFLDYDEALSNDFVLTQGGREIQLLNSDIDDWKITFADTGIDANIGQRLMAVRKYVENDDEFMANYSDGLTDLYLPDYIDAFHRHGKLASFISVKPTHSFHIADVREDGVVDDIKHIANSHVWINGGYFLFKNDIFDYMEEGEELVYEPFQRLIQDRQLMSHRHEGFWASMDTLKDKQVLEELFANGNAPWEVWKRAERAG